MESPRAPLRLRDSFWTYLWGLGRWWWWLGPNLLLVLVQIGVTLAGKSDVSIWWTLGPLVVAVTIAPFGMFHAQRIQAARQSRARISAPGRWRWHKDTDGRRSDWNVEVTIRVYNDSNIRRALLFEAHLWFLEPPKGIGSRACRTKLTEVVLEDRSSSIQSCLAVPPGEHSEVVLRAFVPTTSDDGWRLLDQDHTLIEITDLANPDLGSAWLGPIPDATEL